MVHIFSYFSFSTELHVFILWFGDFMSCSSPNFVRNPKPISYHGFNTPWKHQKTTDFLVFSGGIEKDQFHEMGWFGTVCGIQWGKSVYIPSFSGLHCPAFELNTDQKISQYEYFLRSDVDSLALCQISASSIRSSKTVTLRCLCFRIFFP